MKGNMKPDPASEGHAGADQGSAGTRKGQGFFDTSQRPFERHMKKGAEDVLKNAGIRRCPCGATMRPYFIRRSYVWYLLPAGHELHYRCANCGKAIQVASLSDLAQAMVLIPASGLALFFIARWALGHSLGDFGLGGLLGTTLLVFIFVFSFYQLCSGVRVRRAHPVV